MADITFNVTGVDELLATVTAFGTTTPALVEQVVTQAGADMQAAGDPLTPVRTGFLLSRNQVLIEANGLVASATYYNDAFYSLWVCMGHHTRSGSWVAARDWMTPALMAGGQSLMRGVSTLGLV
jgi:hypothetical protein